MKKRKHSRIGQVMTRIFNVRQWSDYDRVKSFTGYLYNGFKRMFIPQPPTQVTKTFDEVARSQHLTEIQLVENQKALLRLSVFMCLVAAGLLVYAVYQFIMGSLAATVISLVVMCIALAFAFRYHFWYYQIKSRKLGCTFHEWLRHGLMGEK